MSGIDTIVACCTPWGRSALAVVRLSGPGALDIAQALCPSGPQWRPRRACHREIAIDGAVLDDGLVVWMPAPGSYTGEHSVELTSHGNPVIVERIIDGCVALGARVARPGEFTRRALENGRTDVLRSEALAALVDAGTLDGVRLARAGMDGAHEALAADLREALLDVAAELEARLDHPDEDLSRVADEDLALALHDLASRATAAAATWRAGRTRLSGARVALQGPVNAGKSSLFNRLVGERRALVSPEPGTTRDVVERGVLIDGLEVTFLDTAGERAGATGLEAAGQELGRLLVENVDLRVIVVDLTAGGAPQVAPGEIPYLVVGTHVDLLPAAGPDPGSPDPNSGVDHRISNVTGAGIEDLKAQIRRQVGGALPTGAQVVLLSQRQHDLLRAVADHALAARSALVGPLGPAVAAEEVTGALVRLAELRGEDARDSVLDRLFARFCIGK